MKRLKIIYLNTRFTYQRPKLDIEKEEKHFYLFGMGHFLAWEMIKKRPEILVENWRADHTVHGVKEKQIDGMICRVFPCRNRAKLGDISFELVKELKNQAKEFNLIIHIMGMHSYFYDYVVLSLRKQASIVTTHMGGPYPLWKFQRSRKAKHWIYHQLQKYIFLPCFDHVFCMTETLRKYVAGIIGDEKVSKMANFGVDTTIFHPHDKIESRRALNFPLDKKIILQVGRADRLRGIDIILKTWENIKSDRYYIYFVDVREDDELYEMVKAAGVPFCGQVNFYDLPKYYSAADVLLYFPFDEESLNFAGTSYVPLEAMACGTPVVAATLKHFPDDEIYSVCRVPTEKGQVNEMVLDLLDNPPDPMRCRSLVQKHYNWDVVISRHLKIYDMLFKKNSC